MESGIKTISYRLIDHDDSFPGLIKAIFERK